MKCSGNFLHNFAINLDIDERTIFRNPRWIFFFNSFSNNSNYLNNNPL